MVDKVSSDSTLLRCYSLVGRVNLRHGLYQYLSFGTGCLDHSTLVHEFLHVLGLYHEHNSHNRDEHITINWDNIDKRYHTEFEKVFFFYVV